MKNFGFTLIELLAVIAILGVLTLIVILSVNDVINDSESKLSNVQIENIEEAAKVYYLNEGMEEETDSNVFSHCVSVNYLIENGYIDTSEMDEENINGSVKITYNSKKYKYIYQEKACSVCTLVEGTDIDEINVGDKYRCKVKEEMEEGFEDGYYFYVLSTNDDGSTNLIMDRNIYYDSVNDVGLVATEVNKGLVAWYASAEDNGFGPVTAMDYLHSATKDWSNIPDIEMNYTDEGSKYGSIVTTNNITKITKKDGTAVTVLTDQEGYENLKARMPYNSEISGEEKCEATSGSCPLWLVNYLKSSDYYLDENAKVDINGITGYWTLSSYVNSSSNSWYVGRTGKALPVASNSANSFGVRPVITVEI